MTSCSVRDGIMNARAGRVALTAARLTAGGTVAYLTPHAMITGQLALPTGRI